MERLEIEKSLIEVDHLDPNELKDNILYYIGGFIVRKMLPVVKCTKCRKELLLDVDDSHALKVNEYPVRARFTKSVQRGGLIMPSNSVLRLVKATEVIFKCRVIYNEKGITAEKNLKLKIETAVVEQFGLNIFNHVDGHFFECHIGQERDHLTSLMRSVVEMYLDFRLKSYGKRYTEIMAHKNLPSSRHELTKTI